MSGPRARRIIGVGQHLRRDDGVGLEVAARLRARGPEGVEVVESPADPASLMEAWDDGQETLIVDAMRSGAPPGTVRRVDVTAAPLLASWRTASTHGIGVAEAIELARVLGRLPARLVLVGIEGRDFSTGPGLSPEVAAAVDQVVEALVAGGGAFPD